MARENGFYLVLTLVEFIKDTEGMTSWNTKHMVYPCFNQGVAYFLAGLCQLKSSFDCGMMTVSGFRFRTLDSGWRVVPGIS
jgi:hypothetical protein